VYTAFFSSIFVSSSHVCTCVVHVKAHTPGGGTTTRPSRGASSARSRGLGSSNLGSRRRQHLTSTGGKTVSFPRRVAVVLGIAGDIDRTPHELPRSCDVCGDYILGKSFYCDVCTTTTTSAAGAATPTEGRETDADDGDSFDVCSECFAGWQKQPKWPHLHGQTHFVPAPGGGEDGNGDDASAGDGTSPVAEMMDGTGG
jgi:hypothetical protein